MLLYKAVRPIIKFFFKITFRPKILGKEHIDKNKNYILAGNHTNNLDCFLLISSIDCKMRFLGKHTLFKGIGRFIFKWMGVIPVDRSKPKNREALKVAIDSLKSGETVAVFPEGTINRSEDYILPFKMGAVKMAYEANVPLIPFVITGKYSFLKNDLKIEFLKTRFIENENLVLENKKLEEVIFCKLKNGRLRC